MVPLAHRIATPPELRLSLELDERKAETSNPAAAVAPATIDEDAGGGFSTPEKVVVPSELTLKRVINYLVTAPEVERVSGLKVAVPIGLPSTPVNINDPVIF